MVQWCYPFLHANSMQQIPRCIQTRPRPVLKGPGAGKIEFRAPGPENRVQVLLNYVRQQCLQIITCTTYATNSQRAPGQGPGPNIGTGTRRGPRTASIFGCGPGHGALCAFAAYFFIWLRVFFRKCVLPEGLAQELQHNTKPKMFGFD